MTRKKRADPEYGDEVEAEVAEEAQPEEQPAPPKEECTHTHTDKQNGLCKHG